MKCELCGSDRRNSIQYGEFLTNKGKGVHTNCLYLSSGLQQNGSDNEGLMGFLPEDIAAERARVSAIQCCYCGKMRANIGCCGVRCYRTFHMICGIECGAMNQFLDTFRSFCDRHVRKVRVRPNPDDVCYICYEKIFNECKRFSAVSMIRAPCCRNGWFHKYCLQKFAKSAGYFFKCPLCNDSQNFKNHMSYWGIFVQDKDAEWELVPNAFAELLERPSVCGAQMCYNEEGRGQNNDTNPFLYCVTCGSMAIHRHCMPLRGSSFQCDHCQQILNTDSGRESLCSQQQYADQVVGATVAVYEDENSNVDVCGEIDEAISDKHQEENDSDEDVFRPNIKKRNALRLLNDTDDASSSEVEDLIVTGSAHRKAADEQDVFEENTKGSVSDNEMLNCIKDKQHCASRNEADCSDDEGLVNSIEDQQKTHETSWCETEIRGALNEKIPTTCRETQTRNNMQQQSEQQNNANNCIAQRTRRKSIALPRPALHNNESTADDASSTGSYQSSKPFQVFQYDDGVVAETESAYTNEDGVSSTEYTKYTTTRNTHSEDGEQSYNETNIGHGVLDYFYALLHEVKNANNVDRTDNVLMQAEAEDEKKVDSVIERQNDNRDRQRKLDKNETQDDIKKEATNSLDVSCIANRTRRRSSLKMQSSSRRSFSVDCAECTYDDMSSISSQSSYRQPKWHDVDDLNTSCIAKRTRRRLNKFDVFKTINEDDGKGEDKNISDGSCFGTRRRHKSISINTSRIANNCSTITNKIKSATTNNSTCSTPESFKSFEYSFENCIESSGKEDAQIATNTTEPAECNRAGTSKDITVVNQSEQWAQKRKVEFDTPMPSKIPAVTKIEREPEDHKNNFELSCIANRTRRKSVDANTFFQIVSVKENKTAFATGNERVASSKNPAATRVESEPEDQKNIFELSCIANRTRRKSVDANTFIQILNVEENKEIHATGSEQAVPSKSAALTKDESEPPDHNNIFEQSCIADTNMSDKIFSVYERVSPSPSAALTNNESEPESHENIFELSCIANRTRRKSVDAKMLNQIINVEENHEKFVIESEPATIWSINSSPESKSSDVVIMKTPSSTQSSPSSTISPGPRRGQRMRMCSRRFLDSREGCNNAKSSIVHSPIPQIANWSNLKEKRDTYFMPRYMRVNGKLRRVSAETFQLYRQQQLQQRRTSDAQTHFARSYNLLLQDTNINRRPSISRT